MKYRLVALRSKQIETTYSSVDENIYYCSIHYGEEIVSQWTVLSIYIVQTLIKPNDSLKLKIYTFFKTFTNQSQNQSNDNSYQLKVYTLDIYNIIRNSQIFTFNELKRND